MSEHYQLITTPAALDELCAVLRDSPWLALDTEFLREKTYYAQLCLIQVAAPPILAIIDPLAIANITPFLDVLYDTRILKIMHAARQDLELFFELRQALPQPLHDTQIAARLLGQGDYVGYANLVAAMLGITVDKAQTRTDWSQRPLTPAQLQYAAADVSHLHTVYEMQMSALAREGRAGWLEDEFAKLTDPATYRVLPEEAWRKVRGTRHLRPPHLAALKVLAAWREQQAILHNRPRGWIVRDEGLVYLARTRPTTLDAMAGARDVEPRFVQRHGATILALLQQAAQHEIPPTETVPARLTAAQEAVVDILLAALHALAAQHEVAPATLATRRDIEHLVRGERSLPLLEGWRHDMAGARLLALLDGRLVARISHGILQLESTGS